MSKKAGMFGRLGGLAVAVLLLLSVAWSSGGTVTTDGSGAGGDSSEPGTDNGGTGGEVATDWGAGQDVPLIPEEWKPLEENAGIDGEEETTVEPVCAGPGEFLCDCQSNKDCLSGYCVETLDGKKCTKSCVEDCPEGWACVQDQNALPDVLYICLPQHVFLCRPCNANGECNPPFGSMSDLCVSHGDNGSFCAVDCGLTGQCPEGYVCAEVTTESGLVVNQCVPSGAGGECVCSNKAIQEGAWTECKRINGYGECEGKRVCAPGGLTDCSALTPKPEECNGVDDNCDGEIDPPNSVKCISWYMDQDGDGYGIGAGNCLCKSPSPNHVSLGGDCNDSNVAVNPGIKEVCNSIDDDCDGQTDESFAEQCETMYFDADDDGWGDAALTDCLCKESKEYKKKAGDCDNADPTTYPGAEELCDGKDNDCDSVIDEENAIGCVPYYLDQDKDGYGLTGQLKCLCSKVGDYTAIKPQDCDDTSYNVHPTVVELCDGVDNDCDGEIDEGEAVNSCGVVAHGAVACNMGCVITQCEGGYFDLNSAFADGCECQLEGTEVPDQMCSDGEFLGVLPDSGASTQRSGKIVPVSDSDWYRFTAQDAFDQQDCDTFHAIVRFITNPDDAYVFDVFRNGCAGANNLCAETTFFEYKTNFFAETTVPGAVGGECPCKPDASHTVTPTNYADDTTAAHHQCTSQTADFYVRVYRKPGAKVVCDEYKIEFGNGIKL